MKRIALVTGGNRGIGLAICRNLASLGHGVLLASRDRVAGEEAAEALRSEKLDVTSIHLDLTAPQTIDAAVKRLETEGKSVDMLINNAGVLRQVPLLDMPDEEIADSLAVHLTGPIRLIRHLVPSMIKRQYGRIVNLSSGWGAFAEGLGGPGAYGITKAALNALTVRLSQELPPSVKINSMCPGWVRTRMGGDGAARSPDEGAATAIWLATLPDDGPTGGFFRDRQPIGW